VSLRILYLSGAPLGSPSADAVQTLQMAAALAALGHRVRVIGARGDARDDLFAFYGVPRAFEVVSVQRGRRRGLGQAELVARATLAARRAQPFDLVISRDRSLALCAPGNAPLLYDAHTLPTGNRRRVEDLLARDPRVVGWATVSGALGDAMRERYPHLADRIFTAPTGHLPASPRVPPPAGARLVVALLGNLRDPRTRSFVLTLAARFVDADFVIADGGLGQSEASSPNVRSHGVVPPTEIDAYLAAADVLIAPYPPDAKSRAGLPIAPWISPKKVFEYMSAGRALVVSSLPPIGELLTDGDDALLVPALDERAWVDALTRVLGDSELRARLGARAGARFDARYHMLDRARRFVAAAA
jgi:hypothetical protein